MTDWKAAAVAVLRDTSTRAFETCDLPLHKAMLTAIDALQSDGVKLTTDVNIYHLVMNELFADTVLAEMAKPVPPIFPGRG